VEQILEYRRYSDELTFNIQVPEVTCITPEPPAPELRDSERVGEFGEYEED
jgi:hypothetical protein